VTSVRVQYEERALDQVAGFLADDALGVKATMDGVDALAVDPRPPTSFPFGSPDERRLHVGRYRVMYRIHEDMISVWWVGRIGGRPPG
jgi:mRNA interferase RelE/StbE